MKTTIKKINGESVKAFMIDCIWIFLGCAFGAYGTVGIMIPNGLAAGGVTGLARIIQQDMVFDYSMIYYALTAVVVIIVWIMLGFAEVRKILFISILYPATLILFEKFNFPLIEGKNIFLAVIFCGVFTGICNGIVFNRGYSFGGTDSLGKAIRKKFLPHVSQNKIMTAINVIVIISCAFVFGRNIALYALVTQWIATEATDIVLYGFQSKIVQHQIITEKGDEICRYIMEEMGRGVSVHTVQGMYTNSERSELRFLCSPRESVMLRRHLAEIDPDAFVTVIKVDIVWGKGFSAIDEEN